MKWETFPNLYASTVNVASSSLKSKSKRYVCCLRSYTVPLRSASSLVIISPTYSTTNLFFGMNSLVFKPQPRPSGVLNMHTYERNS